MRTVALKLVFCFLVARFVTRAIAGIYFGWPFTNLFSYPYPFLSAIYAFIITYLLLVHPLKRIEKVINQFRSGNFEVRVRMKRRDELGSIATAFDDLADRIQVMIHSERSMTANLGHEIRTPLTRVMLHLHNLKERVDVDKSIEMIETEIQELSNVSTKLLRLAQIERGEIKPAFESLELDSFIHQVVLKMHSIAARHRCEISFQPTAAVEIVTDKALLEIALMNIIDNAIHYTSQNSTIQILIETPTATSDEHMVIVVRDQGQGVPDSHIDRIFMPFERVEASRDRKTGGTGLGLSICRSIVKNLGGMIEARNLKPGFEVRISLPHKFLPVQVVTAPSVIGLQAST